MADRTMTIDVHLSPGDLREAMRRDVRDGLGSRPRTLPPKYFYDARGSELFVDITRLPEYYPTRAEAGILRARADDIAAASGADVLVELGSGASEKTRLILDALDRTGGLRRYVPFDVSADALREAMDALAGDYPQIDLHGVVGDFDHHLGLLPDGGRRLVAFLGSTIGNLDRQERHAFLRRLRDGLGPQDSLLLGTDLVKAPARLVAAYDDAAGVTAEFNRNVLHVLVRELDADVDPEAFAHVAVWNEGTEHIEMRLRARRDLRLRIAELDLDVPFDEGEDILTEISAKFRPEGVREELAAAGFEVTGFWTDDAGDFALVLARPA
ncbi:L-histidine N(alpha)-methyltransferase [Mobilicoccus massiliensis]|uniref:L-histidine N(alpha)-methyltransferase n=1 Tax=Mobilicoccus massiliensis TaxID=1522310 RepID=UPI000694F066|nr:L-histidine N(alpha)-methyltransferase [Mobilicoccus massiliensis]